MPNLMPNAARRGDAARVTTIPKISPLRVGTVFSVGRTPSMFGPHAVPTLEPDLVGHFGTIEGKRDRRSCELAPMIALDEKSLSLREARLKRRSIHTFGTIKR